MNEGMAIVLATKGFCERTMGNRGFLSSFAFVSDSDASLKVRTKTRMAAFDFYHLRGGPTL